MPPGPRPQNIADRFWKNVERCAHGWECPDCCWPWHGTKSKQRQGLFGIKIDGHWTHVSAPRMAWELTHKTPFPSPCLACHTCPSGPTLTCCNPQHLYPGTQQDKMRHRIQSMPERFWNKVQRCQHGPTCIACCWEWTSATNIQGYGVFQVKTGENMLAHRFAWIWTTEEPIPNDLYVLHRCDNRPCVSPAHLYIGTQTDNMRDAKQRGRFYEKIRDDDLPRIRQWLREGLSQEAISKTLGVSRSAIGKRLRGL